MTWLTFGPAAKSHVVAQPHKRVELEDTLFLGRSDGNPECASTCTIGTIACIGRPTKNDNWAWTATRSQVGFMLATFSSASASMTPEKKPWLKLQTSYPSLAGQVSFVQTTFARFVASPCGVASRAIESNPMVPDAVHPHSFASITMVDVPNIVHLHPPSRSWIAIDDCVAMDCDGPKHILLKDEDGSLLGQGPGGSVLGRAEFMNSVRADGVTPTAYQVPQTMLYDATPIGRVAPVTTPVDESGVASLGYGTYRSGCTSREADWNAWLCAASAVRPERLIIESLDSDTETRSLVPVALASSGYVDLINGGQDHGWCFGVSERVRPYASPRVCAPLPYR